MGVLMDDCRCRGLDGNVHFGERASAELKDAHATQFCSSYKQQNPAQQRASLQGSDDRIAQLDKINLSTPLTSPLVAALTMSFSERPPPSTAAIAIASAIVAGTIGYFLGQGKALGLFGGSPAAPSLRDEHGLDPDEEEDTDEEEDEKQHGLKDWEGNEECKLVLVVRTDLGMTKGELYASVSS